MANKIFFMELISNIPIDKMDQDMEKKKVINEDNTAQVTMTMFIPKFNTSLRYIRDTSMYKYNNNYSKNKK